MMQAFQGVYLMQADVDDWDWEWTSYGFNFEVIPIFYILDGEGEPTGEVIDGSAWGANTASNMAPVLDAFFHDR
ncbi:MAG: hypothetical protein AB1750_04890 [Chloroflexota bacterium]